MKLRIRQRVFSWTDSYDVYDETGEARYEVRAKLFSLWHQILVYDKRTGEQVGSIHEKLLSFLPRFEIVVNGNSLGNVSKEFRFFRPRYHVDYMDWSVDGDLMGWDYQVYQDNREIMTIEKELFRWSDTYVLTYSDPKNELPGLLLVLAIDAANCSDHND